MLANKRAKTNSTRSNVDLLYVTATIVGPIDCDTIEELKSVGYELVEGLGDQKVLLRRIPIKSKILVSDHLITLKMNDIKPYTPHNYGFDLKTYPIYDISLHKETNVDQFASELTALGCKVTYAKRDHIRAELNEASYQLISDGQRVKCYCHYVEPRTC